MNLESEEFKKGMKVIARSLSNDENKLRRVKFTPLSHIDSYLVSEFDCQIYQDLNVNDIWKGLFEPLPFFNLFYEQQNIILENTDKPTSIIIHLNKLKLEKMQLLFLLLNLHISLREHYAAFLKSNVIDQQLLICITFIGNEIDKLEKEINPEPEPKNTPSKFDFDLVRKELSTLIDSHAKIRHLIELQTEYKQTVLINISSYPGVDPHFIHKCDLEITKIKAIGQLELKEVAFKSKYKLSEKTGAKINLIRILNALYDLKLLSLVDGDYPSKIDFMKAFGEFINLDLSNYDIDLSQAFNSGKVEPNVKVFEDMKTYTTSEVLKKLK